MKVDYFIDGAMTVTVEVGKLTLSLPWVTATDFGADDAAAMILILKGMRSEIRLFGTDAGTHRTVEIEFGYVRTRHGNDGSVYLSCPADPALDNVVIGPVQAIVLRRVLEHALPTLARRD